MLATANPFPFYAAINGDPLDAGSVYFGVANQNPETNPVTAYWDPAGTQPAAQPIRTLNGFPVREGTPAIIYLAADYSLTVRDKNGAMLYYAANSADYSNSFALQAQITTLANNLASTALAANGAGQVGYDPNLNYVGQTIGADLRTRGSVFAFLSAAQKVDVLARTRTLDLSATVNAAIALIGMSRAYFCEGDWLFTAAPLNLNLRAHTGRNSVIEGAGGGFDAASFGTVFVGNTGTNNWVIDCTGSQWVKMRGFKVVPSSSGTPSTHGIRMARAVAPDAFCHNNAMDDVFVILPSVTGAAGGQGSIAVLNNQCEGFRSADCWFKGDTPYLSMLNNEAGIPGVVDAGVYSNTLQTHVNTVFQTTWKTAITMYGAADMEFERCIWTTDGVTASAVYAITLYNSAAAYQNCSSLKFTGQIERFTKGVYMGTLGSPAGGATWTDIDTTGLTKVYAGGAAGDLITVWTGTAGANLFNMKAGFPQQNASTGTQNVWAADTGNTGEINLYGGSTTLYQSLAGTPYAINNVLIHPRGHDIDAGAAGGSFLPSNIVVAAGSSYRVKSFNSYLRGSVVWDPPSIANQSIGNQAVTVTGAAFGDTVKVFPPYTLSGLTASAYVDAANTVQIILSNLSGGAVNLGSGIWNVVVEKT